MAVADRFLSRVTPLTLPGSNAEARLFLEFDDPLDGNGPPTMELRGVVEGPYCDVARTLTAQFALRRKMTGPGRHHAIAVVTDPCYWTPSLPFLYRLDAEFNECGQSLERVDLMVGLRRWEVRRSSFYMEYERLVLRGVALAESNVDLAPAAREASAAVCLHDPTDAFCIEASRRGVAIIADLRDVDDASACLQRLLWRPAVLIALVNDDVWSEAYPPGMPLARALSAHSRPPKGVDRRGTRVCVIELHAGERPPAWAAGCDFPVIAIRRGVAYADLHEARAACDQLQADLAPEFNLAGYFVAP